MLTIRNSYIFSLIVQLISLIIFGLASSLNIKDELILLKNAFNMEYIVSIIEFIGYIILGFYLKSKTNLTSIRYGDWFVTTNMLLISFSMFLLYNKIKYDDNHDHKDDNLEKRQLSKYDYDYIKEHYGKDFGKIMIFNTLMLVFGFLGEINYLSKIPSLILGMIFFILSFKIIYDKFVGCVINNIIFFSVFVIIWLLYAVAFMLNFEKKNIAYNLLDLVSKNSFGIFLFFYIYKEGNYY